MTEQEQKEFTSELLHAVRTDEHSFLIARNIVSLAKAKGKFSRVIFNPQNIKSHENGSQARSN